MLVRALRQRGVPEPAASLTAEGGIAVFKIAFESWVSSTGQPDLTHLIQESLDELKAGLASGLQAGQGRWRLGRAVHDPGKTVLDLAVAEALGGTAWPMPGCCAPSRACSARSHLTR